MPELTLQSIKRSEVLLRDQVVDAIRRAIIEGELGPGDQVNQAQIAAQLEVSRAVVREALAHLQEEGLIDNIPYRGTFVKKITHVFVEELFSVRSLLENFAVHRFVDHAKEADFEALHTNVAETQVLSSASTRNESVSLDLSFHYLIFSGAQHNVLLDMWRSIETGLRLCLAQNHQIGEDISLRIGMHSSILQALEAKDAQLACELMEEHIRQAEEHILKSLHWD